MAKTPTNVFPLRPSSDPKSQISGTNSCRGSKLMKMPWLLGLSILALAGIVVGANLWTAKSVPHDCRTFQNITIATYRNSQTRPVGYVPRRVPVRRSDQGSTVELDSW